MTVKQKVRKPKAPKSRDYLDNEIFTDQLDLYAKACREIKDRMIAEGIKDKKAIRDCFPVMPDSVAKGIVKIANNLSNKPNFIGYTYKDEMIFDGIENCIKYIHMYDREKSSNGFAYATQIIYYAFVRRIKTEHKHSAIKQKVLENLSLDAIVSNVQEGDDTSYANQYTSNLEGIALRNHRDEWD